MGVTISVEVDRGVLKVGWAGGGGIAVRGGVGCDGCGEVGVTAGVDVDREVAKTGGGKKSARDVGVLEQEPLMNLGMFDNLMTTEAIKGLTQISPAEVLQQGREEMHAASTIFCSTTLRVFQRILAASKSNSCPGCEAMCLTIEFCAAFFWISLTCSPMRTSKGLDVRP